MAVIFATSCTFVSRTMWLTAVHKTAPSLATPTELASIWSHWWWLFVKGYHVMEFALLFTLLWWALPRPKTAPQLGGVWLATVAYGATDEFHQLFVKDRGGRLSDVLIDAGGASLAAVIAYAFWRAKRPIRSRPGRHTAG
jgi:VanZ family protein